MRSSYIVLLLALGLLNQTYGGTTDLTRCPINLQRDEYLKIYQDQCLQFKINDKNHHTQASDYCRNTGGQLLTVKDQFKEDYVVGALSSYNFYGSVWLGLSDTVKEGEYRWVTGEVSSFFHWAFGQPTPFLSAVEDCVLLTVPGGQWYDQGCDLPLDNFPWICEYPLRELPNTQTTQYTTHYTAQPTTTQAITTQPTTESTTQPTIKPSTQPTTMPTQTIKIQMKTTVAWSMSSNCYPVRVRTDNCAALSRGSTGTELTASCPSNVRCSCPFPTPEDFWWSIPFIALKALAAYA